MANTFSQIYIQTVFAVKYRECLISNSWEDEIFKYITGAVQNKGQKMLAINGNRDHIHILIGMKPTCCLSDLVRDIKKSSTSFIKEKHFLRYAFQWQEGFGAFSYGHAQLDYIINYVSGQKEHHKKHSFKDEYDSLLTEYQVQHDPDYLFDYFE